MVQRRAKVEIDWVYIGCGVSLLALVAFRGPQLLARIDQTATTQEQLVQAARNNAIAAQRFSAGCNTEFLVNGRSALTAGAIAYSSRTGSVLPEGAVLCDRDGTTAVIKNGVVSDLVNAATVKRTVIDRGLGQGVK